MAIRETTSILNVLRNYADLRVLQEFVQFQLRLLPRPLGADLIGAHLDLFGRQARCLEGGERDVQYWVWEFDRYTVFVSNIKGIFFEVLPDIDPKTAEALLREYMSKWESL